MPDIQLNHEKYDVIVCGGGPSGAMAAIAAAREGAKVLLVEQYAFLGGTLTAMGVGPMMSFHNNVGEQVVKGYAQELIDRLIARGASVGHVEDVITYCSTVTPFDAEQMKIELEQMFLGAGGTLLYHTMLVDVATEGDRVTAIIAANKAGLTRFEAAFFIDSTGDGDLAYRAGVPFKQGRDEDGKTQPMTMKLKVANVDREAVKRYAREHPERCLFDYGTEEGLRRLESSPRISLKGYIPELKRARDAGEVSVNREFVLLFETGTQGVFIINVSRIQGLDGTNPYDIARAETIGRQQCSEIFAFLRKHCVGFEHAVRMDSAAQVGVRETRRMDGRYTITAEDLLEGRRPDDSIALGGYPLDIHSPDKAETVTHFFRLGTVYGIPLRALVPRGFGNLLMNGRCLSATHEALAGIRTTPQLMAVGQGAGTVAAMAVRDGKGAMELDFAVVKQRLEANGAFLTVPSNFYLFSEDFGKDRALDDPNKYIFERQAKAQ
jgi:hypothetical protein